LKYWRLLGIVPLFNPRWKGIKVRKVMTNRNILTKLFLGLLIILIGSFSFAEDKKNLTPGSATPQQQECPEDDKQASNSAKPAPAPKPTPEKKATNPQSLTPPSPLEIQPGTDAEG
jgi:hypothetical protein